MLKGMSTGLHFDLLSSTLELQSPKLLLRLLGVVDLLYRTEWCVSLRSPLNSLTSTLRLICFFCIRCFRADVTTLTEWIRRCRYGNCHGDVNVFAVTGSNAAAQGQALVFGLWEFMGKVFSHNWIWLSFGLSVVGLLMRITSSISIQGYFLLMQYVCYKRYVTVIIRVNIIYLYMC